MSQIPSMSSMFAQAVVLMQRFPQLQADDVQLVYDLKQRKDNCGVIVLHSTWFHPLQAFKHDCVKGVVVGHHNVNTIVTRHLLGDRDLLACQDELIEAGLEQYARL